jgi:hypothetical protein
MATECLVHGCKKPSVAKGLCGTHRKRVARHGSTEQTRPADWGSREKHPAYGTWVNLRRAHAKSTPKEWLDDFWLFVSQTPKKPEGRCQATREDPTKPWGPNNFYWKEPQISLERKVDRAAYMREWQRKARAANKDYGKNADLKKNYGVTLDWYNAKHAEQGGVCAICQQEETALIHGRLISLAVDHCHDTGEVRGLLCRSCNNAIGAFQHKPDLLDKAKSYLLRHGCSETAPGQTNPSQRP